MKKLLLFSKIIIMTYGLLLVLSGCGFFYEEDPGKAINDSDIPVPNRSTDCSVLPQTKTATLTSVVQISGYGSNFPSLFSGIGSGSMKKDYSDTCYFGTLRSTGFSYIQQPTLTSSGLYVGSIKVTYSGTVYNKLKPTSTPTPTPYIYPCAFVPSSKFVTYQVEKKVDMIQINSKEFSESQLLKDEKKKGNYLYIDTCYSGGIPPVKVKFVSDVKEYDVLIPPIQINVKYKVFYEGYVFRKRL